MEIENEVKKIIMDDIKDAGYDLVEVKYEKEGKNNFLRVVIDSDKNISIDDCICVSKIVGDILDREDPIKDSYILDVCSCEKGSV